jgi:hypothetical protein
VRRSKIGVGFGRELSRAETPPTPEFLGKAPAAVFASNGSALALTVSYVYMDLGRASCALGAIETMLPVVTITGRRVLWPTKRWKANKNKRTGQSRLAVDCFG